MALVIEKHNQLYNVNAVLIKKVKDTEMEGQKGHFRGGFEPWLAWAPK